jgi:hypothetical protein
MKSPDELMHILETLPGIPVKNPYYRLIGIKYLKNPFFLIGWRKGQVLGCMIRIDYWNKLLWLHAKFRNLLSIFENGGAFLNFEKQFSSTCT